MPRERAANILRELNPAGTRERTLTQRGKEKILWLEVERSNNRPKVPWMCKRKCWLSTPSENWLWHRKWNFGSVFFYFRQEAKGFAGLCTFLSFTTGREKWEKKIHWCSFLNSQKLSFAVTVKQQQSYSGLRSPGRSNSAYFYNHIVRINLKQIARLVNKAYIK